MKNKYIALLAIISGLSFQVSASETNYYYRIGKFNLSAKGSCDLIAQQGGVNYYTGNCFGSGTVSNGTYIPCAVTTHLITGYEDKIVYSGDCQSLGDSPAPTPDPVLPPDNGEGTTPPSGGGNPIVSPDPDPIDFNPSLATCGSTKLTCDSPYTTNAVLEFEGGGYTYWSCNITNPQVFTYYCNVYEDPNAPVDPIDDGYTIDQLSCGSSFNTCIVGDMFVNDGFSFFCGNDNGYGMLDGNKAYISCELPIYTAAQLTCGTERNTCIVGDMNDSGNSDPNLWYCGNNNGYGVFDWSKPTRICTLTVECGASYGTCVNGDPFIQNENQWRCGVLTAGGFIDNNYASVNCFN